MIKIIDGQIYAKQKEYENQNQYINLTGNEVIALNSSTNHLKRILT